MLHHHDDSEIVICPVECGLVQKKKKVLEYLYLMLREVFGPHVVGTDITTFRFRDLIHIRFRDGAVIALI